MERRRSVRAFIAAMVLIAAVACTTAPQPAATIPPDDDGPHLLVLGTVQDGGLPHASCWCDRCVAARNDPRKRRRVASLAVRIPSASAVFLIDATPDVREQLDSLRSASSADASGVDRAPLDGVLLTHAHIGHYLGLAFFGFEAVHTRELPVYCSARMAEFLRSNGPWSQLVGLGNIALNEVRPNEPFALGGGVTATAVGVPHRDEYSDTFGFVLRGPNKSVLYVPDTDPWRAWDPSLEARLDGIDVAIIDGSFWSADELPGRKIEEIGHPMIRDSLDRLESRVADGRLAVYFTHLNHSNPALDPASPERTEIERRGFRVLAEGQRIPL